MKNLSVNQMTAISGGECKPEFLGVAICVLRITGNHLTDICHPQGVVVIHECP